MDEFDFLEGIKPLAQQREQVPEPPTYAEFSFLEGITPLGQEPKKKEPGGILEKVKDLSRFITDKAVPGFKEKVWPSIQAGMPELSRGTFAGIKKAVEIEKPKEPTIGPMTAKEKATVESGKFFPMPERKYPKAEELEYGKLEQLLDIPGQFLTQWANMRLFGLPKALVKGEMPAPKSPLAEVAGGAGALYGLANFPVKGLALGKGYAPFEVTGKLGQALLKKPAKTLSGKIAQNIIKNVATLGLGMGAVEWQGKDPVEVLENKARATGGGALTGFVFGGTQFANFTNASPLLNHILRFGMTSAILDQAHGTAPLDERHLFDKAFDYGLNWIFTREGVSPKEFGSLWEKLNKEILKFRKETKEDGFEIPLATGQFLKDKLTDLVANPEAWAEPVTPTPAMPRLPPRAAYEVTPGGTAMPAELPEATKIQVGMREAEIRPEEKGRTVINVRPKEDGSIDIEVKRPELSPEVQGRPTQAVIEGKYPPGFDANGESRVRDTYRFSYAMQPFVDEGWIIDYNPRTNRAKVTGKGNPEEGVLIYDGKPYYTSQAAFKKPKPPTEEAKPAGPPTPPPVPVEEKAIPPEAKIPEPPGETPDFTTVEKPTPAVPKESAKPLINWIRKQGGIRLDPSGSSLASAGELYDIIESKQGYIVKSAKNKSAQRIGDLAEKAHELGLIDEFSDKALLAAIRNEMEGGPPRPGTSESEDYFEARRKKAEKEQAEALYEEYERTEREKKGKPPEIEGGVPAVAEPPGLGAEIKAPKAEAKEPEIEYEATPRKPTVAIKDKRTGEVYLGNPGETIHGEMFSRLERKGVKPDDMIPGWRTPEGKWAENLREAAPKTVREEVSDQFEPKELSEARDQKRSETPEAKEFDKRMEGIEKEVEKAIAERKELTTEQREALKAKGKYEEGVPGPEKELPTPEPEMEPKAEKIKLVRVSVKTPTGLVEALGELPVDMLDGVKEYANKLGVGDSLVIGKEYTGKWTDYEPPKETEKLIQEVLRDVKRKPKEVWEEWQKQGQKTREVWAGLPPPEFAKKIGRWLVDSLQTEPQFKRIGAPDTGLALKRYHPLKNAELEKGLKAIKELKKKHEGLKLTDDEWQLITKLSSKESRFEALSSAEKTRYGDVVKDVRKFFDDYAALEKKLGIIEEEWPKSMLRRLLQERDHYKEAIKRFQAVGKRKTDMQGKIDKLDETIKIINDMRPQYIHIPRTWLELFWEKNAENAPKIITEFFHERKTIDIEALADYLLAKNIIEPKDLDIRRIMGIYSHKAGHKIALAEIFRNAEKEGLIKAIDEAPANWQSLPSQKFPTLRGKKAHPVFVDFFEKNFMKSGFSMPTVGKILGTIKMFQFYNPVFLPMYNIQQAFWTGALTSTKLPGSVKKAWLSMKNKDGHYWDMHYWGGFSTPFSPSFKEYSKQIDRALGSSSAIKKIGRFLNVYQHSWDAAWAAENCLRMVTYHHYLSSGKAPKDAAQLSSWASGDYASIPPAARKTLNKVFFTPSFKISMLAAQGMMIKNAGKYLFGGKEQRAAMTGTEKGMAKMLMPFLTGFALREAFMHTLGYKTDQFGLKYSKTVLDEDGNEKELVLHVATPDNVLLRYMHRFKSIPTEPDKIKAIIDRSKWELHPVWQLGMELLSNKNFSMEPIFNPFDKPEKIIKDVVKYSTVRAVRILELLPAAEEKGRGRTAYKALLNDMGNWGKVMSLFVLPYLRNAPEVRYQYRIQNLIQEFRELERARPAKSEAEMETRIENLDKQLKKFLEQMEKE